jgi:hypothetical protein
MLDANLLILLLIGKTRRQLVQTHKRTSAFTVEDYDALEEIVKRFQLVATTPNVLTEASNLCTGFAGDDKNRFQQAIETYVYSFSEEYVPSRDVIANEIFSHCGLSDAVLAEIATRRFLILTVDGTLYNFLLQLGLSTLNFNHIRTHFWDQ